MATSEPPRPRAPEEIAAWAEERTPERARKLGRTLPTADIELIGTHTFGEPSPPNPAGLRVLHYRLANGLNILLLEDHSAPVFAYQTWLGVGSRHEEPGRTGIAHLFEHLMFKETKTLGEGEFDRIMESHGAETNAATWLDWTMYREELPAGHLELAVRLEADRLENMVLGKEQLKSEREVVKNERRYRVDNDPEGTMYELLYGRAYVRHPYRWPTIGLMEDIESISLEECLEFYETYYAPNNATVIIAGDFRAEEALLLLNAYYGPMEASDLPEKFIEPEPSQVSERRELITMPLSSPRVLYGYHIPELSHEHHPAVQVLHQVLLGGKSGRLHRRLVTELELVSEAEGWVGEFADPGLYEIMLTLKPDVAPDDVEAVLNEQMQRLAEEPISAAELEKARNQLEIDFLREMQSMGDRAYGLGHYAYAAGDWRMLFDVVERYRDVTAEDVQKAARLYFKRSNRTVITAMPR